MRKILSIVCVIQSEALTVTECNEAFSGYHLTQLVAHEFFCKCVCIRFLIIIVGFMIFLYLK